jgi:hypothetical protein
VHQPNRFANDHLPTQQLRQVPVISRHWRGLARASSAEAYVEHLRSETFPALAEIPRFIGARGR